MHGREMRGPEVIDTGEPPYIENGGRREYKDWFKVHVIEECHVPGASVSIVARRYNINSNVLLRWRREIERSTMTDWVRHMAFLVQPLAEAIGAHVRAAETIHADDTPVPVLDPGRGETKTGGLWVALRDERPWGSGVPPGVYFRYAPDRKGIHAE
jgi:transposase-like protein